MNATQRRANAPGARINARLVAQIAEKRGWTTVEEIVAGLGLGSRATFYRYLDGSQEPMLARARAAARRAEVPLDELFPEPQLAA